MLNFTNLEPCMKKAIFALIFFFLALVPIHSKVFAQTATPTPHLRQELRQDVKDFRQAVGQDIKNSTATPSGFNQKLCGAHVQVAELRESSMSKRAGNMTTRLDKIASMVENYYTTKLVPAGKTVSNYDSLVSDVNAKKAALDPLVSKVQSDSTALTCTNGAARGQFQNFRTDASSLLAAFRAYRLSVINLVQAVVKVAGSSSPIVSPIPSPEVTQ